MQDKILEAQILERKQLIIDSGNEIKYNRQGIYGIYVEGKLVYIGKSTNMLVRIPNHMIAIDGIGKDARGNKYSILRQSRDAGLKISFNVLEYIDGTKEDLDRAEAKWIKKELPVLNYQIPSGNGHSYRVNSLANTITFSAFKQLLGKE